MIWRKRVFLGFAGIGKFLEVLIVKLFDFDFVEAKIKQFGFLEAKMAFGGNFGLRGKLAEGLYSRRGVV